MHDTCTFTQSGLPKITTHRLIYPQSMSIPPSVLSQPLVWQEQGLVHNGWQHGHDMDIT